MRELKDSGIEWIGMIPSEWSVQRLKYSLICNARSLSEQTNDNFELQYIDISSVTHEHGIGEVQVFSFSNAPSRARRIIQENDTIISMVRTYLKAIAYIPAKFNNFICSTGFAVCTPIDKIFYGKFMYYALCADWFVSTVESISTGISYPAINSSQLLNLKCIVPSFPEQKRIANFLDEKCATIDRTIGQQQAVIEKLKAYKQSVITEAVTKGLKPDVPMKDSGIEWIGMIPEHWNVLRIKYLLTEINKRSTTGLEEPLSMSQQYGIVKSSELNIPNPALSYIGGKIVQRNDLVFNKLKAHLGVFAVSQYEGVVSPDYAVYRDQAIVIAKHLEYLFKTPKCIYEFKKYIRGVGAGLSRLYTSDLFNIKVAVPALDEQQQIADYLNNRCSAINHFISCKEQIIERLSAYKNSLVYEAVTGKLEIAVSIVIPFPAVVNCKSKRFAQAVLMSKIIDDLGDSAVGRVKLEKVLYTIENYIGFDFDTEYKRQVAGPFDESIYECEGIISRRNKWFTVNEKGTVQYRPAKDKDKYLSYYERYFNDYNDEIMRIIAIFKPFDMNQAEILATLYAAWNDAIISGSVFTDDTIVDDVLNNWHDRKKRFPRDVWLRAMQNMRETDLVPKGYGMLTQKA